MPATKKQRDSFRYPYHVKNLGQLLKEMIDAKLIHGRLGCCGWYLDWIPGAPLVLWDAAMTFIENGVVAVVKDVDKARGVVTATMIAKGS